MLQDALKYLGDTFNFDIVTCLNLKQAEIEDRKKQRPSTASKPAAATAAAMTDYDEPATLGTNY